jgi:hypothetical protein
MVVARLTHQPKVKGLSPANTANMGELKVFRKISQVGQHGGRAFASSTKGQGFKSSHHL